MRAPHKHSKPHSSKEYLDSLGNMLNGCLAKMQGKRWTSIIHLLNAKLEPEDVSSVKNLFYKYMTKGNCVTFNAPEKGEMHS